MGSKWTIFENTLSLSKIIGAFMRSGMTFWKRPHSDIIISDEISQNLWLCILKDPIMSESLKRDGNVSRLSE